MADTRIEWAHKVSNALTGCRAISPGCAHCYARRMATRLAGRFGYPKTEPFRPTYHPDRLLEPATWTKPKRVFLGSMTDLFNAAHSDAHRDLVFREAERVDRHTYLVLTKRPELVQLWLRNTTLDWKLHWPQHVWLGVSVESDAWADRLDALVRIPAPHIFLSAEPLLGPLDVRPWIRAESRLYGSALPSAACRGLEWVIAGPETGPGARPCLDTWMSAVMLHSVMAEVPFFDKRKRPVRFTTIPEGMPR